MELEEVRPKPFFERNWVKYGLIGAGVGIVFNVLIYLIDVKLMMKPVLGYIPVLVFLIMGILAANAEKKQNGNLLPFGNAVAVSWGAFTTALVISMIFGIILFFVIDPSIIQMLQDKAVADMEENVAQGKMTQEQLDQAMPYVTSSRMFLFVSIGAILLYAVGGLIVFLITSIFIRKEPQY